MVLVDHRRALGQLAEIADEPLGIARGAALAACLGGVLGEELGLADDRNTPLHEGRHGGDHDVPPESRQPTERREALGDDVLVRREAVVGQRLPVREGERFRAVTPEELHLIGDAAGLRCVRYDDEASPRWRRATAVMARPFPEP